MNRKYSAALRFTGFCALLAAIAAFFCSWKLLPEIEGQLVRVRESASRRNAFLEAPWEAATENAALVQAFEETPEAAPDYEQMKAVYRSPEGIDFTSASDHWDEAKLQGLYEELLRNRHGEELSTLRQVVVYPQADAFFSATHQNTSLYSTLHVQGPLFPKDFQFTLSSSGGIITLYDGDRLTTPTAMADSLSHEYGHHYTRYHMLPDLFAEQALLQSDYMRLRNPGADRIYLDVSDKQFYYDNHHWYLVEIAAEDYVTLMGSPNARQTADYYDVEEYLNGAGGERPISRNALVQENLMLPMASDMPGLAAYFYSFIGEFPPQFPEKQDMNLRIQPQTKEYNLTTGYQRFLSYTLTWDKAYGEDAVYTLVSYEENQYKSSLRPIRTVYPGESAAATIGNTAVKYGSSVSYADDSLAAGTKYFVVTAILPDGTMQASAPIFYTFS